MDQTARNLLRRGLAALVGLAFCVGTAAAGPFNSVVVFGDSLSDIGNISQASFGSTPGQYYWNGRFSNGPVYAETLATGLGLPPLTGSTNGGNDFAYGGAQTSGTGGFNGLFIRDIDEQVDQFLATRTASASALYAVFAGANDLIGGQTNVSIPVNNLANDIGRLVTAGARQFLVVNLPLLGYTPRFNGSSTTLTQYNTRTQQYNTALATMLDGVQASNPAVTVYRFDVAALFNQALANPQAFGLTNVTASAAPGLQPGATSYDTSRIVPEPNKYMFWDDLHPTAAVHALLGRRALDLFLLPGDFNHDNVVTAADYVVWRNGLGTSYVLNDYDIWRAHFGATAGNGLAGAWLDQSAVPEPEMWPVFLAALCAISLRRRSKLA